MLNVLSFAQVVESGTSAALLGILQITADVDLELLRGHALVQVQYLEWTCQDQD